MEYTTRLGSGPGRAHVNYQCPCGCIGGVIYSAEKPLSKAGACCCGRKLWVGPDAEERLRPYLESGVEYEWDIGSVTLPWGEVADAAMAWPKGSAEAHGSDGSGAAELVRDVVCGMMIEAETAAASAVHEGTTYYFCAEACKAQFESRPSRYANTKSVLDRFLQR